MPPCPKNKVTLSRVLKSKRAVRGPRWNPPPGQEKDRRIRAALLISGTSSQHKSNSCYRAGHAGTPLLISKQLQPTPANSNNRAGHNRTPLFIQATASKTSKFACFYVNFNIFIRFQLFHSICLFHMNKPKSYECSGINKSPGYLFDSYVQEVKRSLLL